MLDPVGFWSYTRHDDAQSDGQLSQLRVIVGKAIALQYGADVLLWQDVTAIPFGADWEETIDETLGKTTFFMPIVTPRYLKSERCFDEYAAFRRRSEALGRKDLVFPVHYVGIEDMVASETVFGDGLKALRRHQWIDFRPHIYSDPRGPDVRRWAGELADSILSTLRRGEALPEGPGQTDQGERPLAVRAARPAWGMLALAGSIAAALVLGVGIFRTPAPTPPVNIPSRPEQAPTTPPEPTRPSNEEAPQKASQESPLPPPVQKARTPDAKTEPEAQVPDEPLFSFRIEIRLSGDHDILSRNWRRAQNRWVEIYPEGKKEYFNIVGMDTVNGCKGTVAKARSGISPKLVFISNRGCEGMPFYIKEGNNGWGFASEMYDVR